MFLVTYTPLSPSLPDAIMKNLSVSYLNSFRLRCFADNRQIQDSGSGLFANTRNSLLITEGTFTVSVLVYRLYNDYFC